MQVWQYILLIFIIAIAFPIGKYLAKICKEEMRPGKKIFKSLKAVSLLAALFSVISVFFITFDNALLLTATFLFIFILARMAEKQGKGRKS